MCHESHTIKMVEVVGVPAEVGCPLSVSLAALAYLHAPGLDTWVHPTLMAVDIVDHTHMEQLRLLADRTDAIAALVPTDV